MSLAAFALTSEYVGSFALAMVMMFVLGVFTTGFTTGTQTSLQMMVPDQFRGRVMGFYGMTFNIRPLGGVQASALASIGALGAPFALAIGGAAVVVYTIVSVALKRDLRTLDARGRRTRPPQHRAQVHSSLLRRRRPARARGLELEEASAFPLNCVLHVTIRQSTRTRPHFQEEHCQE